MHCADGVSEDSKPIYGLIFLFRWREDDPDKQEAICPERLWFANQVRVLRRSDDSWLTSWGRQPTMRVPVWRY